MIRALILCILLSQSLSAQTLRYLRQGASGANNGTSWTDAWVSASTAEGSTARNSIIYVADGSYSGTVTCDTANSSTQTIEWRKATASDHGTETGWDSAYGDGQATFSSFILGSDYWIINGVTRNESDWDDGNSYGFRITEITASTAFTAGVCAANVTIKYVNAGGAEGTSYTGSEPDSAIKIAGFDELALNWTIQRCYLHNIAHAAHLHLNGVDGITIEYNWISNGWGKEAIRGQIAMKNAVVRYNWFFNAGATSGVPGEGCTAEIAIWDGNSGGFDNVEIYGNVILRTNSDDNSGGAIVVGGNGSSWVGPSASNCKVYNNTIAGIEGGSVGANILINGGSGNEVRNTLWYDCVNTPSASPNTSNNGEQGSNPFVNYAGGNLHLSAGIAGTSLSSPYNTDMDGAARGGDGTFDRGAFEFQGGGGAAIQALNVQNLTITGP